MSSMNEFEVGLKWILIFFLSLGMGTYTFVFLQNMTGHSKGIEIIENYASEAYSELDKTIEAKQEKYKTVILPFCGYENYNEATPGQYEGSANLDERYFGDCLYNRMFLSNKFRFFTRVKLKEALKELNLQMQDIFDPKTAKRVGKFMGADLLVVMEGYIGDGGDTQYYDRRFFTTNFFNVKVLAIDIETAEVKGMWNKNDSS